MIRGTTPTFIFAIDIDTNLIDDIEVTFKQNFGAEIQKELKKDSLALADRKLFVTLSQADTFAFKVGACQVQMRILTTDGKVLASEIAMVKVEPCLSSDVLEG